MKNKKIIIVVCITALLSVLGFVYLHVYNSKQTTSEDLSKKQMRAICELASLETLYHNTAKFHNEKTTALFFKSTQTLWIEYDSSVKIGTDISKLSMDVKGNKVTITLPHSKILSNHIVEGSLKLDSYHSDYSGWFADDIDFSNEQDTFKKAEKIMLEEAKKNNMLFVQADERAEDLLTNYVNNIGETLDKKYDVYFEYIEE